MAMNGFKILGNDAMFAIPCLVRLMQSSNIDDSCGAMRCLFGITSDKRVFLPEFLAIAPGAVPTPIYSMKLRVIWTSLTQYRRKRQEFTKCFLNGNGERPQINETPTNHLDCIDGPDARLRLAASRMYCAACQWRHTGLSFRTATRRSHSHARAPG